MTSPEAIEAAILAVREYTSKIYIGDFDSGGYNRFSMDEVYKNTGIIDFAKKYDVEVVNLSRLERKPIQFNYKNKEFHLDLPRFLLEDIDLLVTMPVPKVHANTGVSLTFKNQWGCIPENRDRLRLHPYFEHVILEVNKAVKSQVAIVDGRYGLTGNGPMLGVPVKLDCVMVTDSIGAGARLCCDLMQIPLEKIRHLNYAKRQGFVPETNSIIVNQDFHAFQREKFTLKRKWTDYPGYFAFRSPFIAHLAYFSPFSQLLHNILYLFREPFYQYNRK